MSGRTCTRCNEHKPSGDFYKQKGGKNGLHSMCKPCLGEYKREKNEASRWPANTIKAAEALLDVVSSDIPLPSRKIIADMMVSRIREAIHSEKACRSCGETKLSSGFANSSASVDGKQHTCKACIKSRSQKRQQSRVALGKQRQTK